MNDMLEWNKQVIAEFRANEGRVGGQFAGAPMVLLTTTGAKTGKERTSPLMSMPVDDRWYVFASKGGAPTDPDWYRNLKANPNVTVEYGTETFPAIAEEVSGEERDRIYARQAEQYPGFAEYERLTDRKIPVIALKRL